MTIRVHPSPLAGWTPARRAGSRKCWCACERSERHSRMWRKLKVVKTFCHRCGNFFLFIRLWWTVAITVLRSPVSLNKPPPFYLNAYTKFCQGLQYPLCAKWWSIVLFFIMQVKRLVEAIGRSVESLRQRDGARMRGSASTVQVRKARSRRD